MQIFIYTSPEFINFISSILVRIEILTEFNVFVILFVCFRNFY